MPGEVEGACVSLEITGPPAYLESLYRSLHPDNMQPGRNMEIREELSGNSYSIQVCVKDTVVNSLKTIRSTIYEVLSLIEMLEELIQE